MIFSCIASFSIDSIKKKDNSFFDTNFNEEELAELSGIKINSLAGLAVCKAAVLTLYNRVFSPKHALCANEIVIEKNSQGAPRIKHIRGTSADMIRISISHSRNTVCACAVIETGVAQTGEREHCPDRERGSL